MPIRIPSSIALAGALGLPAPLGPIPKIPVLVPEPVPPIQFQLPVALALQTPIPEVVRATAKEASVPETGRLSAAALSVASAREALGVREEGQKPSGKDLQAAFDGAKAPARRQEAVDARSGDSEDAEEDADPRREPGDPEFFTLPEDDLYDAIYGEQEGELGPGALR